MVNELETSEGYKAEWTDANQAGREIRSGDPVLVYKPGKGDPVTSEEPPLVARWEGQTILQSDRQVYERKIEELETEIKMLRYDVAALRIKLQEQKLKTLRAKEKLARLKHSEAINDERKLFTNDD